MNFDWEKEFRKTNRALLALGAGMLFLVGVVAWTVITNANQDTTINHIQQAAPCQVAPGSRACQKSITGAIRTCAAFEPCRSAFLAISRKAHRDAKGGGHSGSPPGNSQPGGGSNGGPPSPSPGPPSPGPAPTPAPNPQPNPNPKPTPQPPPAPKPSPGPVGPVTQTVCHVNPLGVHICVRVPVG